MEKIFIGLGGNVGKVAEVFEKAIKEMNEKVGPVTQKSSLFETEPWGYKDQQAFLNQVICVETELTAKKVLQLLLQIEKKLGRTRDKENQFAPRTIDIDLLFYGDKIINENDFIIPHPRLQMRNFVLIPLNEIAPGFVHPVLNKKIKQLMEINTDKSLVKKI